MDTIVVGYDGSEAAERALARAAEIAAAFSARVVVASIATSAAVPAVEPVLERAGPALVPGAGSALAPGAITALPDFAPEPLPDPEEVARRRLERARMTLASRRIEAEYVADVGDPAERLLDIADHHDADLIVVGSRGHGLLERLLRRPVDEAVARRTDRDVLLVH